MEQDNKKTPLLGLPSPTPGEPEGCLKTIEGGVRSYLSIASFVAAIVFAAVGMALPPQGEIDSSVLILAAQLFVLCATFLGIKDINIPQK